MLRLYEEAVRAAREAVKYDVEGEFRRAIVGYLKAFDLLMILIKTADSKKLRDFYASKAEEYLNRAYELKKELQDRARRAPTPLQTDKELADKVLDLIIPEKPNVSWDDVADLEEAKKALEEAIIMPLKYPKLFEGVPTWRGILLFGPPGCGKTLIAKAAASECDATFFNVSVADIMVKWVGESEQRIQALFRQARKHQPSIIFLDEVDAIGVERTGTESAVLTRVLTQLLQMMDGLMSRPEDRIVVLAATNRPWNLDSALLRRFDKRIYIPLPDREVRKRIIEITIRKIPNFKLADDVDLDELAMLTEGFTGDDLKKLCMEAWYIPIRELRDKGTLGKEALRPVNRRDFIEALKRRKSSVSPEEVKRNIEWAKRYGAI